LAMSPNWHILPVSFNTNQRFTVEYSDTLLDAVSTFNLGYSITDTRSVLRRRFHVDVPDRTINSWLTTYRSVSTYARLRAAGKKLFDPRSIIASRFFERRQVYRFQVHNAKLELSLQSPIHHHLSPLRGYLTAVQRGPRGWASPPGVQVAQPNRSILAMDYKFHS